MKKNIYRQITLSALIAAMYAVLTYICTLFSLSFGPVQLRISEVLTLLPVFTPAAIPGLAVGCLVSNLVSPYGIADMVFGTAATILAAFAGYFFRKIKIFGFPLLSALMPVVFNSLIIGGEIYFLTNGASGGFWLTALFIGLGELAVCVGMGIPFYAVIKKYSTKLFGKSKY